MKFGVWTYATAESIPPGALAREAEMRGFESIWFPDHSHIPASRETPWPGGSDLPRDYYRLFDPLIALTAAAASTTTIRLATGVAVVTQRDPLQLAKEIATLDVLSRGRVIFGVGAGWNREEMRNHGTDPRVRGILLVERIEAMQRVWTDDCAEFHGELVAFDPLYAWPKPVQEPYPPIHFAGLPPVGPRRALAHGEGWVPMFGRGGDHLAAVDDFRAQLAEAGRDPTSVEVTIYAAPADPAMLAKYVSSGVDRVVLTVPGEPSLACRALDDYATLMSRLEAA